VPKIDSVEGAGSALQTPNGTSSRKRNVKGEKVMLLTGALMLLIMVLFYGPPS